MTPDVAEQTDESPSVAMNASNQLPNDLLKTEAELVTEEMKQEEDRCQNESEQAYQDLWKLVSLFMLWGLIRLLDVIRDHYWIY